MNNRQTIQGIILLTIAIAAGLVWMDTFEWANATAKPLAPDNSTATADEWERLIAREDLDPDLASVLRSMQHQLQTQKARQNELAEELARLRLETGEVSPGIIAQAQDDDVTGEDNSKIYPPDLVPGNQNEAVLLEAGFNSTDAREIAERLDSIAMERLNLRYELAGEDIDRREYRESLTNLPSTRELLQNTYGDDAYDRYLYATGRSNRLVVNEVYKGSPAENIGLLPGDMVISWDNQRVYSSRDLMSIATNNKSNDSVRLRIERDGSQFELYIPWGPLGITSRRARVDPSGE